MRAIRFSPASPLPASITDTARCHRHDSLAPLQQWFTSGIRKVVTTRAQSAGGQYADDIPDGFFGPGLYNYCHVSAPNALRVCFGRSDVCGFFCALRYMEHRAFPKL